METNITRPIVEVLAIHARIRASKLFNLPIGIDCIIDSLLEFVEFISVVHPGTNGDVIRSFPR